MDLGSTHVDQLGGVDHWVGCSNKYSKSYSLSSKDMFRRGGWFGTRAITRNYPRVIAKCEERHGNIKPLGN